MAQNFIGCDRDQSFLMSPDVRDWLSEGHLAWFVLDAVAGVDLGGFYGAYRRGGVGRRAYDPAMVVVLLLYAYARGVRSARKIERGCEEDVAFKTIAMLETPDHATIARFVARHEAALGELFGQVLGLCDEAGLVRLGVVAIDGTRLAGNASRESTLDFGGIAREILAEAKATDEAEDELYGDERGDELPEELRTRAGRAEFFRRARQERAGEASEGQQREPAPEPAAGEQGFEFDAERIVARSQGREGWTRDARRQLERRRWEQPDHVSRAREDRLLLAGERLEAERDAQVAANRAYEDYRENGRDTQGRRLGRRPKEWVAPELPEGVVSVSDPDTQRMKANHGYVQGYNAQAVVDEGQIVLAAEITNTPADFSNLDPMITAAIGDRRARAGGRDRSAGGRARGRAVLERGAHGPGDRQQAHPGADPAGLRRANGATAGLDRRAVRMDASGPGSPRQGAVPKTDADDRARVRSYQAQPHDHPLPPQRPNRRAHRVATTDGNPQPHQAPPPPAHHRRGLKPARRRSHRQNPANQSTTAHPAQRVARRPLANAIAPRASPGPRKR
jgi:transposase